MYCKFLLIWTDYHPLNIHFFPTCTWLFKLWIKSNSPNWQNLWFALKCIKRCSDGEKSQTHQYYCANPASGCPWCWQNVGRNYDSDIIRINHSIFKMLVGSAKYFTRLRHQWSRHLIVLLHYFPPTLGSCRGNKRRHMWGRGVLEAGRLKPTCHPVHTKHRQCGSHASTCLKP